MSDPASGARGPTVPDQLGPYEILESLSALDGAERYLATTGSELVQISVMLPDPTKGPLATRELSRAIKQLTSVEGEHVVRTFRAERAGEATLLVTQNVTGRWLPEVLASAGRLDRPIAIRLLLDVAAGLASVHESSAAHGDVRPASVLIGDDGHARLGWLGFGSIATLLQLPAAVREARLPYRSPEEQRGRLPSIAGDLFSYGVLFHELVLGTAPAAPSAGVVAPATADALRSAGVPEQAARFVLRLLSPTPSARPTSVRAVLEVLEEAAAGLAPASREEVASLVRSVVSMNPSARRDSAAGAGVAEPQPGIGFVVVSVPPSMAPRLPAATPPPIPEAAVRQKMTTPPPPQRAVTLAVPPPLPSKLPPRAGPSARVPLPPVRRPAPTATASAAPAPSSSPAAPPVPAVPDADSWRRTPTPPPLVPAASDPETPSGSRVPLAVPMPHDIDAEEDPETVPWQPIMGGLTPETLRGMPAPPSGAAPPSPPAVAPVPAMPARARDPEAEPEPIVAMSPEVAPVEVPRRSSPPPPAPHQSQGTVRRRRIPTWALFLLMLLVGSVVGAFLGLRERERGHERATTAAPVVPDEPPPDRGPTAEAPPLPVVPTPEPERVAEPAPVAEPVPEAAAEPAPAAEPVPEPAAEVAPVAEPAPERVAEPTPRPSAPVTEPVAPATPRPAKVRALRPAAPAKTVTAVSRPRPAQTSVSRPGSGGMLRVSCSASCEVRVDGAPSAGATGAGVRVRDGSHVVVVKNLATGVTRTLRVFVPNGVTVSRRVSF